MSNRPSWRPTRADLSRPSAARVYDYFLDGSSNFAIDREFARRAMAIFPGVREYARLNRLLLQRVVRFYVEQGVRQFLDIGSGIPTVGAVHEVAQGLAPDSRVVYVDNEAIAIAHSQLVLRNNPLATIVQADLREPEALLSIPELADLVDTSEPVGVLMLAMLHFVADDEELADLLTRYRRLLAPGSYLAISHGTEDSNSEITTLAELYRETNSPATLRTKKQVEALFDGFELLEPGVVFSSEWRPDAPEDVGDDPGRSISYAGVGRKPAS